MAFEVLQDGATIHTVTDRGGVSEDGNPVLVTVSVVCKKGDILEDKEISPVILELYESGDERIQSLIKKKEQKKATPKRKPAAKKTTADK